MFRVRLKPTALARLKADAYVDAVAKEEARDKLLAARLQDSLARAKRGERAGPGKKKYPISSRVALLPKSVRDSWASEESAQNDTAPEFLTRPITRGDNHPPELIETPNDDVLKEDGPTPVPFEIADKAMFLLNSTARFKVLRGGRGSAKSWSIARALIHRAHTGKELILCVREFQNSIADSVHRLISEQIAYMGLEDWFDIQQTSITSKLTGSEFIFKGMHRNIREIKSTEGVTICWLEEAQSATEESIMVLFPTIRGTMTKRAEIWISFNPYAEDDPIYTRFGPTGKYMGRGNTIIQELNWRDNPWFTPDMEEDRQYTMTNDPDVYDHVWEGGILSMSDATILRGKFRIEAFDTPEHVDRFFYGVDWGFSVDPCVGTRSFIVDKTLHIDYEAYEHNVELEDLPAFLERLPESRRWPIKADSARPETISYVARQGFNITAAEKWPGSVEDGIAHLRGFDMIVIHPRCVNTAREARMWSWKRDRKTQEVLPIVEGKHDHTWDATRYSLDGYIQARGGIGVWRKLMATS